MVEYAYDSWGKKLSTTGTLASTLGKYQPFRYRGYVYDEETQWYYLQSRYYDPAVRRFISADVYLSTGQGVLGHNAFAYCLNNPTNMFDAGGEIGILTCMLIGLVVGAAAGAAYGAISSKAKTGQVSVEKTVKWGIIGGIAGAALGAAGWGISALVAKLSSTAAATAIIKGGGSGYSTFYALKKALGSVGEDYQWHHIVEQCQIIKSGFSKFWIHNTKNIIAISNEVHTKITAYYNSIHAFTNGMRFRDWLAGKDFKTQFEWGIKILRMFGVKY